LLRKTHSPWSVIAPRPSKNYDRVQI
jgi:hypothetical protein